MTTAKHVARRADVSVGTVSNVLNHPEKVLPATRERVLSAMRELGYRPSTAGRALQLLKRTPVGLDDSGSTLR